MFQRGGGKQLGLHAGLLAVLCAVAFYIMEWLALTQWLAGRWYLADVGNIQYCLVNTWTGKFMYSQLDEGNFFASHFSPALLLLLPLVRLSDYPIPLVTAYQLALALTPIPIYIMARQRALSPWVGLAAGFWFVCNHFVGSLQLANHFEAFYVLLALGAMAALRSPARFAWVGFAVGAISVKEDCAGWLLGYAVWEWVFYRGEPLIRQRALKLAALCGVWLGVAGVVLWWQAQTGTNNAGKYVSRMNGVSLGKDNLLVLLTLVASSGALCLANWRAALLLLIPLPVLLGNFEFTRQLLYYYSYPFLPFLAYATVAGAAQLQVWFRGRPSRLITPALAVWLVVAGSIQYALPTRVEGLRRVPMQMSPRDAMRRHVMAEVLPRDVPVAMQFGLWGVVPWRADSVLLKPGQIEDQHYLAIDQFGVHGLAPEKYAELQELIDAEISSGRRTVMHNAYDFLIVSPASDDSTSGVLTGS